MHTLEISDESFEALARLADSSGTSPEEWLDRNLHRLEQFDSARLGDMAQIGIDQIARGEFRSYDTTDKDTLTQKLLTAIAQKSTRDQSGSVQ